MAAAPYIPPADADFALWLANFATLTSATPAAYGLTVPEAAEIAAQNTAFQDAYTLAVDPTTRTSVTVAGKDAARASAEIVVRPFAQEISRSASVSNELKVGLGLNLPNPTRPPIPPPVDAPALSLRNWTPLVLTAAYANPLTPSGKAKPVGSIGVELWQSVGTVAATDPAQATYVKTVTKAPFRINYLAPQAGKIVTLWARFVTRSGPGGEAQAGPWSNALVTTVVGAG